MAKMVKCPTCGTAIEVPTQPGGQIVKCPGCGKGLKLVVKKPAGAPPSQSSSTSSGGSVAGHSTAGTIAAMSFAGDPPPLDDVPSFDSTCAVCGRPTEPDKLAEDNGKLVCPDCIKGARSKIDRPTDGAEMIDFAAPTAPVRRAPLINITPMSIIGALAALILIGCQIYLTLIAKPVGNLTAKSTQPAPAVEAATTPSSESAGPAATPETTPASPPLATAPIPKPAPAAPASPPTPATAPVATAATAPSNTAPTKPPLFDSPNDNNASPIATTAPSTKPTTAVAISTEHLGPLDQGIAYLQAKDYLHAERAFEDARRLYPLGDLTQKITPEQELALCGEGAALIGEGRLNDARAKFNTIFKRQGEGTRGAVLNHAIAESFGTVISPVDLGDAAARLKTYLESHAGDEFASDVFGTVLYRLSHLPSEEKPERYDPIWAFLDAYRDQIAAQANSPHANQLMWGIDWMPSDDVKRYRLLRGKVAAIGLPQAQRDLDVAKTRVAAAQRALDAAKAAQSRGDTAVDLSGAQRQFDMATANLQKAQDAYTQTSNIIKQPRWLEKPEPVVPDPITIGS